MHDLFTRVLDNRPTEVPVARKPIQRASAAGPLPAAAVDSRDPWIGVWGVNQRLNGRLPLSLPSTMPGAARLWRSELAAGMSAVALLTADQRVVALGSGRWALYDMAGRLVASEPVGSSEVELDDRASRIAAADMQGNVRLWRVGDGAAELTTTPFFTRGQLRTRLATRGSLLVLVSQKMDADVHAEPERKSMIEVIDLTRAPKPGMLSSRIRDTNVLLSVVTDRRVVLATEGRLYFLDLDLRFTDAWSGDFVPMGISLDEADQVYLQARVGPGVQLWKLSSAGALLWGLPLPPALALILQPPVVGYDHKVYLVSAQAVLALDPEGRRLWQHEGRGPIGGAVATADGRLLVSEGEQVIALDAAGRRELIADVGEALSTPPALAPNGRLYVASRTHLFALQLTGQ